MYSQSPQRYPSPKLQRQQTDMPQGHNQDYYRRSLSNFDLDNSEMEGNYTAMHRNASLMISNESERISIMNDYAASPKGRVMDKKKMKDADVKFADKTAWKKEGVCNVCQRSVDTGGRGRHHCRLCASTVCGPCSHRRINDRRVCDTCFYKKKLEAQEKKMEESLAKMDGMALDTKSMLDRVKEDCEYEREKCRQLEAQIDKETHIQEDSLEKQSKVKYGFLNNLNKAKEVQQNLNAGIEKNKTLIAEKESKLRSLKTKLATLTLEVSQKSQRFKDMTQTFEGLLQKHRELNEGKNEPVVQEVSGPKIIARNYSLLGSEKEGKYNISVQPVKI